MQDCSKLLALPALPSTLQQLACVCCYALEALPNSLSSTAVSELHCYSCALESLPQLPLSLVELEVGCCGCLLQLPALPEGLKRLCTDNCAALAEVSSS